MTVAGTAASQSKKLMKLTLSLFRTTFNSSKCKTAAKMAVARIKLLRNKRQVVVRQMRRDIAMLLQSGQDATARIRVEHVIREQNVLAANEFIELFCELVVSRLSIIAKQKECPLDLKEGIASLLFAAPRCSEIPELMAIRDVFEKKYGKDFVSAATDLRPSCGVNRMLIDKLSVRTPTGEVKLKVMKEIAKEYQIEWDTAESETELLKPPEELIEGPKSFASATSFPLNSTPIMSVNQSKPTSRSSMGGSGENDTAHFQDTAAAAAAAAESAKQAIAAAQAAAYLANNSNQCHQPNYPNASHANHGYYTQPPTGVAQQFDDPGRLYESQSFGGTRYGNEGNAPQQFKAPGEVFESRNFEGSHYLNGSNGLADVSGRNAHRRNSYNGASANVGGRNVCRRNSYNAPSAHSDIKFDESDCDEESDVDEPFPPPVGGSCAAPNRPPPPAPSSQAKDSPSHQVHPKLPDYDEISARFEALKHHRKSIP